MNLAGNTIIITGGSSGIGLELAKVLVEKDNTVIICSRSQQKLEEAKAKIPALNIFSCDLSKISECERFREWIVKNFPKTNVLINNAAIVHKTNFNDDADIISKAELEMRTNFLAPLSLTKFFLPVIRQNNEPKIIFVTTGLVYAPKVAYPVYCATKAALHSFIQTLRIKLNGNKEQIIEVVMTVVDTPFHQGNPPKIAISVEKAVKETLAKLAKGKDEIKIGGTKTIYIISRMFPGLAIKMINSM